MPHVHLSAVGLLRVCACASVIVSSFRRVQTCRRRRPNESSDKCICKQARESVWLKSGCKRGDDGVGQNGISCVWVWSSYFESDWIEANRADGVLIF